MSPTVCTIKQCFCEILGKHNGLLDKNVLDGGVMDGSPVEEEFLK